MPLPRDLSPVEAQAALAAAGADYVDVRSSAEFEQGHAPGAVNVPLLEFDPARGMTPNPRFLEVVRRLFPKDRPLIVGCASGGRSKHAQTLLLQDGYDDVANLLGGFQGAPSPQGVVPGWATCGLPVARDGVRYADALKKAGL